MAKSFRFAAALPLVALIATSCSGPVGPDEPTSQSIAPLTATTHDFAWVWAQQSTGTFVASPSWSRNSSGDAAAGGVNNTISAEATGVYVVSFPNVGAVIGGDVQVTAYGTTQARCKVIDWFSSSTTLDVEVGCFDLSGAPANTLFAATYVRETSSTSQLAYAWADQPTTASYTASSTYQFNSTGASNVIHRASTGVYTVVFPGFTTAAGTADVTAYGGTSSYCETAGWSGGSAGTSVNVRCFDTTGNPVDSFFTIAYGRLATHGGTSFGYAWAGSPTTASYTPAAGYQLEHTNSSTVTPHDIAVPITVTREAVGTYLVDLPELDPILSTAKITAYGAAGETCNVLGWGSDGNGGTDLSVGCFAHTGTATDASFDVSYATTSLNAFTAPTANGGVSCGNATVANGAACIGVAPSNQCDEVSLSCDALPAGTSLSSAGSTWSPTFSDENSQGAIDLAFCPAENVVTGISCAGSDCDNVRLLCTPLSQGHLGSGCFWTRFASNGPHASPGFYVHGAQCSGDFCAQMSFYECPVTTQAPAQLLGAVTTTNGSDVNRCAPDVVHLLNRINPRGDLLAWQYANAGYLPLDSSKFHTETIVRLPYFGDSAGLNGSFFVAAWSDPSFPRMGVAKLGFKGGNHGLRLGTNRAWNIGAWPSTGDWYVAPNPSDTFLNGPGTDLQEQGTAFYNQMNHPGGAAALGSHVVVPLQAWIYQATIVGIPAAGVTPSYSQPVTQIWDMTTPSSPQIRSSFISRNNGSGTSNVSAAMTKLANGHFLLAAYKDTPISQMEFYLSPGTNLDDPHPFGSDNREPDAILPGSEFPDWQNFSIVTDCTGALYLVGLRSDNGWDAVDNYALQITQQGSGISVNVVRVDRLFPVPATAPAASTTGSEAPVGYKHMYCSDSSQTDQCDFAAAGGVYVDPNGQVLLYASDWDGDGGTNGSEVYGNGDPWRGSFPAFSGYIRGMEFHERHGRFGPATSCPTMNDAWIEFYEDPNFNSEGATAGRSFHVDFTTAGQRSALLGVNDFNEYASSVRWCLPSGSSFAVFRDNWSGPSAVFNGSGTVNDIPTFVGLTYPNGGGSMNDSISSFVFQPGVTSATGAGWSDMGD